MRKFFSYDGWFLRILTKIGELIILNLIFLVCCIPVVTIGPAIVSLYYAVVKNIRRDYGTPVHEFFSSMKRVIGKGSLYTLALIGWIAGVVFFRDLANATENTVKPPVYVCDFVLVLTAAFAVYIFPVLSRFDVGVLKTCRLAFMMSIRFFYFTVPIVGVGAMLAYLVASGIIPAPCLLFVPAIWCFLVSFPMETVLLTYMPKPEEGEDAWYYPPKDPEKEAKKQAKKELIASEREKAKKQREARRKEINEQRNVREEKRGEQ